MKDEEARVQAVLDGFAARSLRPALLVAGILTGVASVAQRWVMPDAGLVGQAFYAITALLCVGTALVLRNKVIEGQWAHPGLALLAGLLVLDAVVVLQITASPALTAQLAIISIASGVLFLSTPWLLGVFAIQFLGWTVVAARTGGPGWIEAGFILLAATTVAALAHGMRTGTTARLVGGQLSEERVRRRFQALSEAAYEGVLLLEGQGTDETVIDANRAACDLFGRPRGEVLGMSVQALLDGPVPSVPGGQMDRTVGRGDENAHIHLRRARLDDRGPANVLLVRDVTAERLAEKALEEAHKREKEVARLQEQEAIRTRFLDRVGQELAHHMRPLLDHAESMRVGAYGPLVDEQKKALRVMDSEMRHLEWLIQELLDTAHVDSEALPLHRDAVDLQDLVEACLENSQLAFDGKGIDVRTNLHSAWVHGDPQRLGQVVGSLLSNAYQFTKEDGHVDIHLTTEGGEVTLQVKDDGGGFEPARAKDLFAAFPEEEKEGEGVGLSLFIARGIVERHGGSIEAESAGSGKGATFTVRIPAQTEAPPQMEDPEY